MRAVITFDVTDLLRYAASSRFMTGIQRVQMGVVLAALSAKENDYAVDIVVYSDAKRFWQKVPHRLFTDFCDEAQATTETNDRWHVLLADLSGLLASSPRYEFTANTNLINLGTAWALPNYLLAVRNLRRHRSLKYVQYVHDLIPVIIPDTCASGLPGQFTEWLVSAFASTDLFLVNSRTTSNDLLEAARKLGVASPPVALATLDVSPNTTAQAGGSADITKREGLSRFVLLVGTLEPRKNHLFAFNVWSQLLMRRGGERTPTLVCVGRRGWLFEPIFSRLEREAPLARKVRILENVTDLELETLYKRALFTFYPSRYEGWGMPITESLCYGKIPIIPNAGPFTEAGNGFAMYFEPGSEEHCVSRIESLLESDESRRSLERKILAQFRPRKWVDVWADVKGSLETVQRTRNTAPNLPLGQMVSFGRLERGGMKQSLCSAEIYRAGNGWSSPGASGCTLTGQGAELYFSSDRGKDSQLRVYIAVRGSSNEAIIVTLEGSPGASVQQIIKPKSVGWLSVRLDPLRDSFPAHRIRISVAPNAPASVLVVAAAPEVDLVQRRELMEAALHYAFGFDQDPGVS